MVTVLVSFSYLCDVFVLPDDQGSGLGTAMVKAIVRHPGMAELQRQPLATDDAHELHSKIGYTPMVEAKQWMLRSRPRQLIIRRQPLHPGTRTSLLPDLEYRFWGHYSDQKGDPAELDRSMRAHAHVEDFIGRLKDSRLERFPFTGFEANQAWLQTVCWVADLVGWFQMLCLTGPLAVAKAKRLRWTFWYAPARIITTARRDIVRILDGWPTASEILAAYRNIAVLI